MFGSRHTVVVYTTPTCAYCRSAKAYLRQRNVRFSEIDVSRDERAAADLKRRTGRTAVPVILIDGRPVVGFDRRRIDRMLGL